MPTTRTVATPYGPVDTLVGGAGPTLVVLHDDTGRGRWTPALDALADSFTVYAPSMPGYDNSPLCEWMRDVRQLGCAMAAYLDTVELEQASPSFVVGIGFGGWVAAELLLYARDRIAGGVLVAPVGLKPTEGAIVDQFLISSASWARLGFADDAGYRGEYGEEPDEATVDSWERNRTTTTRLAWRPYMYDLALPHLLAAVKTPTLVLAGQGDRIVPPSVAARYADLIPGAKLEVMAGGHRLDLEHPSELAAAITGFLLDR